MRRAIPLFLIIILTFFCILYGLQKNQEKISEELRHEVIVTLAVVEVFVTDKEGNFIDGLTKDDFEIYEDGKKVEIQYFAIVKPEKDIVKKEIPEKITVPEIPPPPQKMKLVILFDNINTHRFYLVRQWPQIVEMFKALSGKVEETMIMELNRFSGMRIIQPFTKDQDLLADKIFQFSPDFWKEYEEHYLRSQMEALSIEASIPIEKRILGNPEYLMFALNQEDRYLKRMRLGNSFSAFLAAVNYIRRFDGVKSVLIVSDGFRLQERGSDIVRIFDPFEVFGRKRVFEQHEAFEKFLELINEERLIFYTVSPRGLRQYFSAYGGQTWPGGLFAMERDQWEKEIYTLEEMAYKTGGMYLKGEKKYEDFIEELGRDLTHFYDISYTPPKESRKKGFHRIEVRVKRPGLIVRHREGYSDFTDEELENRAVASAFISPSFFRDIAFSCKADFIALRREDPHFWVRIQVPLDQFREEEDITPPEKLGLMFGINQWEEDRVHFGEGELGLKHLLDKGYDTLYHVFLASGIELKPGDYETRVILREAGDQIGGWEDSIKILDMKEAPALTIVNSIFGLLRKEAAEGRVPFSLSRENGSLTLSQYEFLPYVENGFKTSENVALFLQILNPQNIQDFSLQLTLLKDEEEVLPLPSQKIESFFDKKWKLSNEVYRLDFKDIPPGDYRLQIKSPEAQIEKGIKIIS